MTRKWYELKAQGGGKAALFIYGDVVSDRWLDEEVSANSFLEDLSALGDITELDLHINSPGGNVFAGIAIYTALRSHPAAITAFIDGVAASIASVIMCGADRVLISDAGMIMVHNPWSVAIGDADDLRKQADMQDKAKSAMINAYLHRVAMTEDEISAAMDAETWYTANEAIELGWADDFIPAAQMAASVKPVDLSRFENVPKAAKKVYNPPEIKIVQQHILPGEFPQTVTEVTQMTDKVTEPVNSGGQKPADVAAIEAAAAKRALEADKARRDEIGMIFSRFPAHSAMCAELQNDLTCTPDEASKRLLAKLGEGVEPASKPYRVEMGESERDKFMKAAEMALNVRSRMIKDDPNNEYRGCSLLRLAEYTLEMSGIKTRGMSRMEIAGKAFTIYGATHSTSDFSKLLANTANKAMLLGYEEAPETFGEWTRAINLSDFKTADLVGLSEFNNLDEVKEAGEYKHGTMADRREQITLATYGKLFSITRQAIINDDLDAFTMVPRKMGRAAARKVGDLAWAILTANAALSDGIALFHASHSNLAGTGAAPSTATVDAGRTAMAKQKDSSSSATQLNIRPAFALVPHAHFGLMSQVVESETEIASSQNNSRRPNYVRNIVRQVIPDARLDTDSATAWYLAADPMVTDTVVIGYLDGVSEPFLEQRDGWTVDGAEYKVRIDAAAKAGDFRGLYKNAGA